MIGITRYFAAREGIALIIIFCISLINCDRTISPHHSRPLNARRGKLEVYQLIGRFYQALGLSVEEVRQSS